VPLVVETCASADYVDETANTAVTVTPWDTTLGKKCIKVKAGSTVTWAATVIHPLVATAGGTTPSPIPATGATTSQTIAFPNAGVYGWQCAVHLTLMHGAIWVVP
jgi:plastocyanin